MQQNIEFEEDKCNSLLSSPEAKELQDLAPENEQRHCNSSDEEKAH